MLKASLRHIDAKHHVGHVASLLTVPQPAPKALPSSLAPFDVPDSNFKKSQNRHLELGV